MPAQQLLNGNFKQVSLEIYGYQEQKLKEIALREKLDIDSLFRYFVELYIHRYMVDHCEIKERCFCNKCGDEYPKRKMHLIMIGYDEFKFCNKCYFGGEYKIFIKQMI